MARSDIKAGSAFVELIIKGRDKFRSGLAKAGKRLASFAKAGAIAVAGMAASVAGSIGVAITQFVKLGDSLEKTSSKIGISVEALSELHHAAKLSGVATNTLDMALQRLTRRASEAAIGKGEAVAALKELGINAKDFNKIPLDAKLSVLADKLEGVTNQSDRVRIAFKLFDSEGVALVNMLQKGSGELEQMRKHARDAGLTMSTETAESAARLGDMLETLWDTIKQVTVALGAAVAPLVESVLPTVQVFATQLIKWTNEAGESSASTFSSLTTFISEAFTEAFSTASFVVQNWRQIFDTATVGAALAMVRFGNQTIHVLEHVVQFWKTAFSNLIDFTSLVFDNLRTNIENLREATKLKNLFSGEGIDFRWTALTDGVESALKELPSIAKREMGPLEKALQDELNSLASDLTIEFGTTQAKFRSEVAKFTRGDPLSEQVSDAAATGSVGQQQQRTFATFSAAALAAQGGGRSREIDELQGIRAEQEKMREEQVKTRMAIERGGPKTR